MSWGCGSLSEKTIGFRPTNKSKEAIKKLLKENAFGCNKATNKSDAVNKLIEKAIQLEHTHRGDDIFQIPLWMYCPETRSYHLTENLLDPHNETGCKKCRSRPQKCRAWNNTGSKS